MSKEDVPSILKNVTKKIGRVMEPVSVEALTRILVKIFTEESG